MKKFFTLLAATAISIAANAASTTAKFGSADNSAKDTQVTCPGFTIADTYVAGGNAKVNVYGSDKGMKLRANKTDNTLILAVDENTTITALAMGIVTNDAEQILPITDVLVDDKSVTLDYPIDTYNTTNADGSAVINLTGINATKTIGIKFDTSKYTAKNVQVFIAGEVTYEEGSKPAKYPEALSFTLNGEKELAGVTVSHEYSQGSLSINIEGTSTADEVTLTFDNPEGWDGFLIAAPYAELSEIEFAKTRSEDDWMSLEDALNLPYGFQKANSITFPVDEEGGNFAWLALVKGDQVYQSIIDLNFNVAPAGNEPTEDPVVPEELIVDVFDNGLTVTKGYIYGVYTITVEGEVATDTYDVVIDIPEGWDGLIGKNLSSSEKVIISENNIGQKGTRAEEYKWISVEKLLADGCEKGNRFTFEPTYVPGSNNSTDVDLYLYKGDQAIADEDGYGLMYIQAMVSKKEGEVITDFPDFPETYEVTLSCEGPEVTQGPEMIEWTSCYVINVNGECTENELTVTVAVPEGWDGFYGKIDEDSEEDEAMTGTRGNSEYSYWFTPAEFEEFGITGLELGNELTFNVDGESHTAQLYLTKGGKIAYYPIILNVNVKKYVDTELLAANQAAYNAVIEKIEAVEAKYEDAVNQIKEVNPDFDFSMYEEIPQMIESYKGWAAQALAAANEYGEEYEFAFDGEEFDNFITMMLAEGTPAPEMPKSYDVTVSDTTLAVTQGDEDGLYTINVEGKTKDETVTVTVAVPEGFDGFIGMSDSDLTDAGEINPLNTRAEDEEESWVPVELIESLTACKPCTALKFTVDGEEHYGMLFLVKGELAWSQHIEIVVNVTKDDSSAVEGIDAVDSDAAYFDLQGNRIANPAKGMYIKVVDGKATKVVVK